MKTYPVGSPAAMRLEPSLIDRAGEDAERDERGRFRSRAAWVQPEREGGA